MVTKIEIKNPNKSKFNYIKSKYNKGNLVLPDRIEFRKGKNILVGENGCGKSTILNIIAFYTFCKKTESSKVTESSIREWFHDDEILNGIEVYNNYEISTFKSLFEEEKNNNDSLSSFKNFANTFYSKELSAGENTLRTLGSLFQVMFSEKFAKFDKNFLSNSVNDYWENNFKQINEYFIKHHVAEPSPVFTVLLDEPDRNLSLNNIKQLYTVLSEAKHNEQMIAAIHNPLLIYKLSKLKHINFIELTPNYIKNIKNVVEKDF